ADETLEDVRTGDGTQTGHTEHGSHLGSAEHLLQLLGGELAHQELFQLVEELVDDPVGADLDPRRLGGLACLGLGTDVEPDDHGLGDLGQRDVVLVDATDTGVDDLDPPALAFDLSDRVAQCLERTLGVGLDDDVEGGVLGAKLLQQTLETVPGAGGHVLFETEGLLALGGDAAGLPVVLDDLEEVAGSGHVVPAHDLDGGGRAGLLDLGALIAAEGPGTTGDRTGHEGVALAEGAALDDDGGDGAAAPLHLGLDHDTGRRSLGVGLVVLELGDQVDDLEEVVDAETVEGGHLDAGDVTTELFGDDPVLGELGANPDRVGAGQVDLVDGDDQLDAGGLGVGDGLDGLGHDAVVGGDHEDDDVGEVGATGTQRGEGGVAGGVDKGDATAVDLHLIG